MEDIFNDDREVLQVIREFAMIKEGLTSGDISRKYSDITSARLLSRLGRRLERRIDVNGTDMRELLELARIKLLLKLIEDDEDRRPQEPVRYRIPLIDPNTGRPVTDANGNIVFMEYAAPPGSPVMPFMPFMGQLSTPIVGNAGAS